MPWDFPRPHELFLLETAWQCFCWASKLLSCISEALQPVSIGLRNCHPARFQQPLKPLKPSQQLCHGTSRGPTNCFCWKLPSGSVSVGLRRCYLAFPRRYNLFLLGFETAIRHVSSSLKILKTLPAALPWDFPRPHELFLLETAIWQCFCWASKLLSGISEALQPVSIGLRNCHPARFQQPLKPLKTLPAALPWDFPRPHELFLLETAIWQCFCWASQLLSGICEALQPVSIELRNCHPARFQQPLKPLKASQQLCHGTSRGPTNCFCLETAIWQCFCWASQLLSGISGALQPVSIGLRNCHPARFQQPLKPLKTLPAALPWDFPRPHELFLLETAIWQCFCWASKLLSGISGAPQPVSIGLRNCHPARFQQPLKLKTFPAPLPWDFPRPHELFLLETAIWQCFCWASQLLSGISEALQPVSIGLRNCHPARFQQPLKPLKPSQQLCHGTSRGPTNCFCWKLPSGSVSVGLRSCYLAFARRYNLFLLGFETAIRHVSSSP